MHPAMQMTAAVFAVRPIVRTLLLKGSEFFLPFPGMNKDKIYETREEKLPETI